VVIAGNRPLLELDSTEQGRHEAAFIAAARTDVPMLLDTLARVVELLDLRPCPMPDGAGGMDLCPCDSGAAWPCNRTRAAWIAGGLDPEAERRRIVHEQTARRVPDRDEIGNPGERA
jgi:hypothetical protein